MKVGYGHARSRNLQVYMVRVGLGWVERFFLRNSKVWAG